MSEFTVHFSAVDAIFSTRAAKIMLPLHLTTAGVKMFVYSSRLLSYLQTKVHIRGGDDCRRCSKGAIETRSAGGHHNRSSTRCALL